MGYFKQTIEKASKHQNVKNKYFFDDKSQLAEVLNLTGNEDSFYVECEDNYIKEIRVCYDLSAVPGNEQLTQCSSDNFIR